MKKLHRVIIGLNDPSKVCDIFPPRSVIYAFYHDNGCLMAQPNENNGLASFLPKKRFDVESFDEETTHFCGNCGKEFWEPENFEPPTQNAYFKPKKENLILITCARCANK